MIKLTGRGNLEIKEILKRIHEAAKTFKVVRGKLTSSYIVMDIVEAPDIELAAASLFRLGTGGT